MSTTTLLLQLIVVLGTARACGWLLRYLHQPQVVGEMAAGLLLGPAVLGALLPELHGALFGKGMLVGLNALSTLGLVLFMFVIGLEIRAPGGLRAQVKSAGSVGVLSVLVPAGLTLGMTPALYPALAPQGVGFWPFALFVVAAVSITAFPVMARILKDKGMTQTRFGQLALAGAAVVDVFAWVMLALVVALSGAAEGYGALLTITLGTVGLLLVLYFFVRPLYARLLAAKAPEGEPSLAVLAALMLGLLGCAAATEWLHLHAVFGAFLFGAAMPRDERLLRAVTQRVEPMSIVMLMPIFFALAGLSTSPAAFQGGALGAMVLVVAVASIGKLVGGALGARAAGLNGPESMATGALMNARGLMELIVIKVGLDVGLIGQDMFTILLVMALVTTAMTSPLINLALRVGSRVASRPIG
ncbi:cation:proton antiporter [Paucibacter sp. R3-3]|uniref:Cation:proton antiporter n=1 Tax=Roseateles agri TaxID=3098619 RepID=A0ABU5DN23_9BURK|nr:cation:proton antiporter [Paucibacter sp. R3-3]MDY0747123.1 cation:proton antiporter [Paucibacter sp. R3-3]